MDDGIKQRLIGAVVLVALGVIFIPMLFEESVQQPQDIRLDLPARPDVPRLDVDRPQPLTDSAAANDDAAEDERLAARLGADELPVAWTLQLASFEDNKNAEALRDRLREAGYKAYVQHRPNEQPRLARVFVGPELKREAVEKLQQELKDKLQLSGIVTRYQP